MKMILFLVKCNGDDTCDLDWFVSARTPEEAVAIWEEIGMVKRVTHCEPSVYVVPVPHEGAALHMWHSLDKHGTWLCDDMLTTMVTLANQGRLG